MPTIAPFRGILYNQSKVDIGAVVAPPYDVISPEEQNELYARNPYNVVRLILGREVDRYASAANYFRRWQDEGILVRDADPAIYFLKQTFRVDSACGMNGKTVERKGFIALCKLEEFEKGVVLPHEKTLSKPKEDRLKLIKATKANFSQVFALYEDAEKKLDQYLNIATHSAPSIDVDFEGVNNKLWKLVNQDALQLIIKEMKDEQVLIADGHHRYETGLAYRDWVKSQNVNHTGSEPYNFIMMFFTNLHDEGLVILPTHRLVHSLKSFDYSAFVEGLKRYFDIEFADEKQKALGRLRVIGRHAFVIAVQGQPRFILAHLRNEALLDEAVAETLPREVKQLDVTLLHSRIIGKVLGISAEAQELKLNLDYVKDAAEALDAVQSGKAQIAFLMNPTKIEEVRAVAQAGYTMPQKSTYFYPKLLSGLVMNKLEEA